MSTQIVTIDLDTRSYDIYIGPGLVYRIAELVPMDLDKKRVFVITDTNAQNYAQSVSDALLEAGVEKSEIYEISHGEHAKSFQNVEKICQWLLESGVNRDSVVFAVGGGVVGDLAGFCASVVVRGVSYVQVPTTLLAQVDSSVGGKTGINVPQGKNLVGSFYQPEAVIADIDTLKTLPERELKAGYAEIVKYGLINDVAFFAWLEEEGQNVLSLQENALVHAVEESVKAKAMIVEADEREAGRRALLNLGHTFGHALEAAAGYNGTLLHGEAVSIGMVMAFDLSVREGLCSVDDYDRMQEHLNALGLPTRAALIQPRLKATADELYALMHKDKKVSGGRIHFVVVDGIGEAFVSDEISEKNVKAVLHESLGEQAAGRIAPSFGRQGVKGLWKSAFSSRS